MKARDYALRACVLDAATSAALRYAALAASLDDQYNLQSEYLMALKSPIGNRLDEVTTRDDLSPNSIAKLSGSFSAF